ncbi:transposase-like protein [Klebsiella sp. BIGb0407]|nr:transposase-like protein [Klebsiella sp. BIGb0407]
MAKVQWVAGSAWQFLKIIYTMNTIEQAHNQFRQLANNKGTFRNENTLLK